MMRAGRRWGWAVALALVVVAILAAGAVPATVVASTGLGPVGFGSIVVDDTAHHVFVSGPQGNVVDEFDFHGNLLATVSNVYGAWGMTISGNHLYVAESTTGAIVRIDLAGSTLTPQIIASGLNGPRWLVMTGGRLWSTEGASGGWGSIVSIDPTSGVSATLSGSYYEPDLAVSPGDASTLFVAEDGLSPGALFRFDVSSSPPTQIAHNGFTDQENIEGLAVSPDGTRVIPASGYPYLFEELSASTLQADGLRYPGSPYPSAVAVSASGLLATGLDSGYSAPDIAVYQLGAPSPILTETTNNPSGTANVLPHGLALSADGAALFAVTSSSGGPILNTFPPGSSSAPPTTVTNPPSPGTSSLAPQPQPSAPQPQPGGPQPPHLQIFPKKPRAGRPDLYLELGAVRVTLVALRTHAVLGYRYYFSAKHIRCINGATNVVFTVDRSEHIVPCRPGPMLINTQVAPHKTYRIRVLAVRIGRHRIVKSGASYSARLYMPGSEAQWIPIAQLPPSF
jgi:hypothetical protein